MNTKAKILVEYDITAFFNEAELQTMEPWDIQEFAADTPDILTQPGCEFLRVKRGWKE